MDTMFISCQNNSLLVPVNVRIHKKMVRNNSCGKMTKSSFVSGTVQKLQKPETSKSTVVVKKTINIPIPIKKHKEYSFDIDMNFSTCEEMKEVLSKIIDQEVLILKTLEERCGIVSKMIKTINSASCLSEKDAENLVNLIEEMGKTVIRTSEMEIELGVKNRLYEKKSLELASFKANFQSLQKRNQQSENELKDLREKIKNLQEENIKLAKMNEAEKHRSSEVNNKMQTLEDTLWVLANSATMSPQDSIVKLKSAINALLRDAYDYKKDIQKLKFKKEDVEFKLQQLNRENAKLRNKLKEYKMETNDALLCSGTESSYRKVSKHFSVIPEITAGLNHLP